MTFTQRLEQHASLTSSFLAELLSAKVKQHSHAKALCDAMEYAVLNGGKRFRPFLVLETASLFEIAPEKAVPVAAALEAIHCYSLVHDDLPAMDDDKLRRGRPTVHIAFDEATAILAGDGLLTLAFEILSSSQDNKVSQENSARQCELIALLAKAAGWAGMVGGQALDLAAETDHNLKLRDVERIQELKTGALITFACEAGAVLGGAKPPEREALITYGQCIGRAFQIADDLLDIEGDPEKLGKATEKDGTAGKATLVSLMGVEKAKLVLNDMEMLAIESLSPFGDKAQHLIEAAHFVAHRDY